MRNNSKLQIKRLDLIERLKTKLEQEKTVNNRLETEREAYVTKTKDEIMRTITGLLLNNLDKVEITIPSGRYGYSNVGKKDEIKSDKHLEKEAVKIHFSTNLPLDLFSFRPVSMPPNFGLISRLELAIERLEMAQNEIVEVSGKDDYFSLI